MSTDEGLVGLVPYLRRFARALTGTQALGDACVVAALEHLLRPRPLAMPARIALYRFVIKEVDALASKPVIAACAGGAIGRCRPAQPVGADPVGRQAFLLVAMEEFSVRGCRAGAGDEAARGECAAR